MPTSATYTAVYTFGDSLSDAGDAYLLTRSAYAAALGYSAEPVSPPYFQETYGTTTANVFSNGPVWAQLLAQSLGDGTLAPGEVGVAAQTLLAALTPTLGAVAAAGVVAGLEAQQGVLGAPNPYLQLAAGVAGGTDFAIGGSVTGTTGENSSATVGLTDLAAQLGNFQASVPHPVAGALYTVWSGSNDLLDLLQDPNFAALDQAGTVATDIATSVGNEIAMVSSLVADGAQSVLVLDVPDLGHVPAITQAGSAAADSIASAVAASFDQALATRLQQTSFGTAHVALEDTYSLIDGAVADPAKYGLTNVTAPVYTGSFSTDNGTIVSTDPAVQDSYLFFDQLHPTETGQAFVAAGAEAALGVACFAAGTRIAIPDGLVAVERLRAGDLVVTRAGAVPVRWVGRRHMALAGMDHRGLAQPVRIRAGAFAAGIPARDLLLSPEHAVFVDGVLVPVRALTGCAGIAVDPAFERITYVHIELDRHDVLLAEGLACESWRDTGNRTMFANAGDAPAGPADVPPCAPFLESGTRLDAIRARLGGAATQELRLDGPGLHHAAIAAGTGAVRLATRAGRAPGDARLLGAAIAAVTLDGTDLALDDARLASGFHPAEAGWRWTDGAALLTVGAARSLRVEVVAVAA